MTKNKVFGLIYPHVCRTGWKGVWDQLHSIFTGKPLFTLVEPLQLTFYCASTEPVEVWVSCVQLESKKLE